jgi:hypothetical protein
VVFVNIKTELKITLEIASAVDKIFSTIQSSPKFYLR